MTSPSININEKGMDLRDYLAAHALSSTLGPECGIDEMANLAYQIADAMIAEKNKV